MVGVPPRQSVEGRRQVWTKRAEQQGRRCRTAGRGRSVGTGVAGTELVVGHKVGGHLWGLVSDVIPEVWEC